MDVLTLKLHYQVFIGAVLGIAAGIVLGGAAQYLRPIGIIYVMLLDVVVYPYIICSLIGALGDIEPRITFRLFRSGFFVYLLLLALVFSTSCSHLSNLDDSFRKRNQSFYGYYSPACSKQYFYRTGT
jgi:Na+/H+-dicarboxylate symporter